MSVNDGKVKLNSCTTVEAARKAIRGHTTFGVIGAVLAFGGNLGAARTANVLQALYERHESKVAA